MATVEELRAELGAASVEISGKQKHLGYFAREQEAGQAYELARRDAKR